MNPTLFLIQNKAGKGVIFESNNIEVKGKFVIVTVDDVSQSLEDWKRDFDNLADTWPESK